MIDRNALKRALLDAYWLIRTPRKELQLWRDYLRTRKDAAFVRGSSFPPSRKTAILILLSDSVYATKVQMLVGIGLRLRGFHITALVDSRLSRWVHRYCAAFGVRDLIAYSQIQPSPEEMSACKAEARRFLAHRSTFQEVKGWHFRGSWIGPQILSSVSRARMEGAPDPSNPDIAREIDRILPDVLEGVYRAERLFEQHRPDLCTVVEANYASFGPLVDVAIDRDIDVIQTTQPFDDDALVSKRLTSVSRRAHPSSISPETAARLSEFTWTESLDADLDEILKSRASGESFLQGRNQPNVNELSSGELTELLALDSEKRTAVLFAHILWDANLFYGDDLFEDYGDWFIQTVRAAAANPDVNWIVKLHPANLWKRAYSNVSGEYSEMKLIRRHVGPLPPHVRLLFPDTRVSSLSLFKAADFGVTVRGTAGMEMPCFGKRVFTAGTGRYSGLGFTEDSGTSEEYLEKLSRIQSFPALSEREVRLARKHAYFVFRARQWRIDPFKPEFRFAERGTLPLEMNLVLAADSLREVRERGDIETWARWAEGSDIDFLNPRELRRLETAGTT